MELQKFSEALEDFEAAKKIEPKTANVDSNIEKAKEKLKEKENEEKKTDEKEEKPPEEEKVEKSDVEKNEDLKNGDTNDKDKEGFTKSDAELLQDIEVRMFFLLTPFLTPRSFSEDPGGAGAENES